MYHDTEIESVSEYISLVDTVYMDWRYHASHIWFRGINDLSLQLLPGLCWRNIDDEDSLVEDFQISYSSLLGKSVKNPWEFYALMQHYGMPTRLLDWTKSPLMALYFALEGDTSKDAAVWVLDPFSLNEQNHSEHGVFVPIEKEIDVGINLNAYLPSTLRADERLKMPEYPIAIEPPFSNSRILAQQGCFTLHGSKYNPLNDFISNKTEKVFRIIIKNKNRIEIINSLYRLGLKEEDVYRDLNSLSTRIVREVMNSSPNPKINP